jgi:hypothetical protein
MNLFGSRPNSEQQEIYAGIQVTDSILGTPVPFVAGRQRVQPKLIYYTNFQVTTQSTGGSKGGNSSGNQTYNYSAAWIVCIGLGPSVGINRIWNGRKLWDSGESQNLLDENLALSLGGAGFTGSTSGTTLTASSVIGYIQNGASLSAFSGAVAAGTTVVSQLTGTAGGAGTYQISISQTVASQAMASSQAVWGGYPSGTPAGQMVPYANMVTLASSDYNLGGSASMPDLTYELEGCVPGFSDAHGMYDADATAVIPVYLQHPVIGAGFAGTIQSLQGVSNTVQAYCMALGLTFSPYENTQRAASDYMKELMQLMNCSGFVSVGQLKILPLGDQAISNTTPDGTNWSWTPNLTPVFTFTDDHFCPKKGETPVKLTQKRLNDTHNSVNIQYNDRADFYNAAPVNASLVNDIALTGQRLMNQLSFPQITNPQTALMVGRLILQVDRFEINTVEFRTRQDFCQLEPNDYFALVELAMGYNNQVFRCTELEDDEDDFLVVRGVEIPGVVRTTPQYNWNSASRFFANYATAPGSVQAPIIFQMPALALPSGAGPTLGIAVCGQTQNTYWKGCTVYCSFDGGNTYAPIGQVGPNGPARYGVLYENLAIGAANPDVTNSAAVALVNTTEQLSTAATHAQADAKQTLFLVDSGTNAEIMSYGTGVLNAAGEYSLSYLWRGLYGSKNAGHQGAAFTGSLSGTALTVSGVTGTLVIGQIVQGASVLPGTKIVSGSGTAWVVNNSQTVASEQMVAGVPFVRIDGSIFCMAIDPGYAGTTLYFKFPSFNTWGQANEALGAVPAYTYSLPPGPLVGAAQLVPRGNATLTPDGLLYRSTTIPGAWDSDCVSTHAFSSCSVSAQLSSNPALAVAIGFATSTASILQGGGSAFTNCLENDGTGVGWKIYESGTLIATYAVPAGGDLTLVTYDGFFVRYWLNGSLLRTTPNQGAALYIGLALYNAGSVWSSVETGPFTVVTPTQYLTVGTAVVNDTNVSKPTGANNWDSAAVSITGYTTCHIAGKTNNVNTSGSLGLVMMGLCTPAHAAQILAGGPGLYTLLDYAWYSDENEWAISELGSTVSTPSTTAALTDKVWITYDGTNIRYYLNDPTTAVRTVAVSGLTLFGAVTPYSIGVLTGMNSVEFGPSTNLKLNDTAELGLNATTDVAVNTNSSTSLSVIYSGACSITTGPYPWATTVILTATSELDFTFTGTTVAGAVEQMSVGTDIRYTLSSVTHIGAGGASLVTTPETNGATGTVSIAVEATFNIPAGQTTTFVFGGVLPPGTSNYTCSMINSILKSEVIKR